MRVKGETVDHSVAPQRLPSTQQNYLPEQAEALHPHNTLMLNSSMAYTAHGRYPENHRAT